MCCCGASLDAAPPQRGWLTCASVPAAPRAVASVCWPRQGQSLGRHGSRSKSCPSIFPHTPAASPAHPAAHTAQSCQLAPAHRAASAQPSAVRRRAATPCIPSAQHKSCSELALLDPIGTKDSPQQPRPARRLHQDAPPDASLAVTLHHSPGHLCTALTAPTRRSVAASRAFCPHCHLHTVLRHSVSLLPLSVPLVARCSGSVPRADVRQRILQDYISYWPLCIL